LEIEVLGVGIYLFLTGFNTPQLAAKCLFPGWGYPVACCGVVHLGFGAWNLEFHPEAFRNKKPHPRASPRVGSTLCRGELGLKPAQGVQLFHGIVLVIGR
jgi:hypothetical protein